MGHDFGGTVLWIWKQTWHIRSPIFHLYGFRFRFIHWLHREVSNQCPGTASGTMLGINNRQSGIALFFQAQFQMSTGVPEESIQVICQFFQAQLYVQFKMLTGVPEESNPGIGQFFQAPLEGWPLCTPIHSDLISQPHEKLLFPLQIESQFKYFQVFYHWVFCVLLGKNVDGKIL